MKNILLLLIPIFFFGCKKDKGFDNENYTKVEFVQDLSGGAKISLFDYGKRLEDALPVEGKVFNIKVGDNFYAYMYDVYSGVVSNPDNARKPDGSPATFGFKINGITYEFLAGDEVYLDKISPTEFKVTYVRRRGDK